ncbi:MAG TPA: hypothetical protein PK264_22065 [Hyphomicrobiaceae bacterium]|nr:hypothetical protein [Hyphomicrobiaceae bacterium]
MPRTGTGAAASFGGVFAAIKPAFARYAKAGVVLHDEPGKYYIGTHQVRTKDGYRTWFGGAEIRKSYVSVHLIPVYAHPELLAGISPELRKRMQGKSCFNLKAPDAALIGELGKLVEASFRRFEADGLFRE